MPPCTIVQISSPLDTKRSTKGLQSLPLTPIPYESQNRRVSQANTRSGAETEKPEAKWKVARERDCKLVQQNIRYSAG